MSYIDDPREPAGWSRPAAAKSGSILSTIIARLQDAEAWLDRKGRGAWIAAMVLGFVFVWPVGLFLLVYMTIAGKWSKSMFKSKSCAFRRENGSWLRYGGISRSSGNSAFDSYKADTLRRLEEEQDAFEAFLERLRAAKDKQEFDAFMDDRAKEAQTPARAEPRMEPAEIRSEQ